MAAAQGVRVSGVVERPRVGKRVPMPGVVVVLHHFGEKEAGPVDSARTDAAGAYRFTRPHADSGRFVITARYGGVAYVSEDAERTGNVARIPSLTLHDTSSTAPVHLLRRHVLVRGLDPDGSRPVLELLVLHNSSDLTRVAPPGGASFRVYLARGAVEALVPNGQGDIGLEAIRVMDDSLLVAAPIPPGDRQLVVSYVLPATRRVVLPGDRPVGQLVMMIADTAAVLARGVLLSDGVMAFEGERYLRLEGRDLPAGDSIVVELPPAPLRAGDLWWLVVVASAGALAAAAVRYWFPRPPTLKGGLGDAQR